MTACFRCKIPLRGSNWPTFVKRKNRNWCRNCTNAYYRERIHKEWESRKAIKKQNRQRLKEEVLGHYSPNLKCQRCRFSDIRALSIDHKAGHGRSHRKKLNIEGDKFYSWLRRNNYPTGFQVLCMNCQWIKRSENMETRRH